MNNINNNKFKGFAFIKAPAHITDNLIKRDGIAYQDNGLRVEDATSTRKRINNNNLNESQRPDVVVNNYPENQHFYGRKSSTLKTNFQKEKNK